MESHRKAMKRKAEEKLLLLCKHDAHFFIFCVPKFVFYRRLKIKSVESFFFKCTYNKHVLTSIYFDPSASMASLNSF